MQKIEAYCMCVDADTVYQGVILAMNNSLREEQKFVGGYIDVFSLTEDIVIICGDEAVIQGKPLNRAVYDEDGNFITVLAGNLMAVRTEGEEFVSILESDVEVIEKLLKPIEKISCGKIYLKSADSLPVWKSLHE